MLKKYKKAIVTGGAGFIGSHLVEELLNEGLKVISIDDYIAGKEENLSSYKQDPNFQEIKCDITDYDELKKYFKGVDIIFHEAASKKTICLKDPRRDLEINAKGTFNILELARDFGIKKVVHASTGSVYGEAQYLPQDENHPLNPTSYYGVSKLAGERYAKTFSHLYDMDVSILRYFHVYGPRQESSEVGGVVSIFTRLMLQNKPVTVFGDGTQQRSFTFVKDVCKANLLAALVPEAKGEVFNCASGIKITIQELVFMIADILAIKQQQINYANWTPGDIKVFDINNKKIKNKLGMEFMIDFKKGLKLTVDWAKNYFQKGQTHV
jgi:UDP-glucose 4-epimerase